MTIAIRKGIPVPPRTILAPRAASNRYNLSALEVGDSIFVAGAKKSTVVTITKQAKKLGIKITSRKGMDYAEYDADGNGVGDKVEGVGVWRTE